MKLQLEQAQLDILLEALQDRIWQLQQEAAGKFPARPGSHRHQLELQAHAIRAVMAEIEEQAGAQ